MKTKITRNTKNRFHSINYRFLFVTIFILVLLSSIFVSKSILRVLADGPTVFPTSGTTGPITITNPVPAAPSAASPYPSTITVSGMTGNVTKIRVFLNNVTHSFPDDMDIMLQGPQGQNATIMSDVGGNPNISGVNIILDDAAAASLPDATQISSGTFKPTDVENPLETVEVGAPAPSESGNTALSTFNGTSPNGQWKLWLWDDQGGDAGSIGDWKIEITTAAAAAATTTTLDSSPNPSTFGQAVTFMATVMSSGNPVTAGDVTFKEGANNLSCSEGAQPRPLNGSGQATCTVSNLAGGNRSITATYNGVANFLTSDGSRLQQVTTVSGNQFTNVGSIGIEVLPQPINEAKPYPSQIRVSNVAGTITNVTVTFNGLSHGDTDDIDMLLIGPNNSRFVLMSDVANSSANNVTFTLDDNAANPLPAPITAGTFRPTNINSGSDDIFPDIPGGTVTADINNSAAPFGVATFSTAFGGADPNGVWSLYIIDDLAGGVGSISGGWTLTVTTAGGGASTTTSLTSSLNPTFTTAPQNQTLLTATVTSNGNPVTQGNVNFKEGANNVTCTEGGQPRPLNASGQATCTTSFSSEGNHVITAFYNGVSGQFNISNGNVTQVVNNRTTVIGGTQFCNAGSLTINSSSTVPTPGTPYPSNVFVSGLGGVFNKVTANLKNLSHTSVIDIDILLVGPGGQRIILMSDVGSTADGNSLNLTFDDSAAPSLPNSGSVVSGTYKPTNHGGGDTFPIPAPVAPYGSLLSDFTASNPNGTWQLYVVDDSNGDVGNIAEGWCVNFTMANANTTTSVTSSVNPSSLGQSVTFTATVNVVSPGIGTPTGTVQFKDGATNLGSPVALNGSGMASISTSALSSGTHTIFAVYTPTGNFDTSTGTLNQTVISPPTLTKSFTPDQIQLNGSSTLQFTLTNPNSSQTLNTIAFTDSLPSGVTAADTGATTVCTDGSYSISSNVISFSKPSLPASGNCIFSVTVTGTTVGLKTNTTSTVTSANGGTGPAATANLAVVAPPTIAKNFSPSSILVGGTSTLTISITNPAVNTVSLTGVGVIDNFPPDVEVAAPANVTNSCSTGTFTPVAGATSVSISGATIPANTTCHFSVDVKATSLGAKINTTGNVQSVNGGAGGTAMATLNVGNTVTWTGVTSNNWNVATNWSPAQVPSSTNDVLIPNGMIPNEPSILAAEPNVTISGLTVEADRTLSINAGKTLTVNGTLSGDGTINVAGSLSAMTVNSTGSINFTGTTAQTIPAGTYKNLTVNNAAGTSLAGDLTINGTLTLNNGIVSAGTKTITFSTSGTSARSGGCAATTCFITGSPSAGGVKKQFSAGANPNFTFPVGTSGGTDNGYTPLELENINAGAAGDHLTVRTVDDVSPATILTPKITRYWEMTESGNLTADLTFTYLDGDDNSIVDPTNLTLYRNTTNICATDCVDEVAFTATATSVTEFSPWTIAQAIPPAPDTMIDSSPPNPSNSSNASFTFSSSAVGSTFECDLDGSGFAACASPKSYMNLAQGSHTFQVRSTDIFGSVDPTPASYTWTIDTAPPDTSITANPTNPSNSTSASFSFTGTDSGTGVASFECKLDAGAFAACTSPKSYSGLSNSSHTFQVRAIDGAGNVDPSPASYTWTVDNDPPDVTINQAAGQSDPANGMGIQIHFTAVFNESVTGFTNSDVTVGGTAGATTAVVTEIAPMNGTTYDVAVSGMTMGGTVTASIPANRAQDAAGNQNTASTSTDNQVTYVPNTPPVATPDSYSTTQDTPLNVPPPGVLSNDSDPDPGNTITAVLVSGPANAQSFALNANGSFNYTPTAGFTGTDSFTYKARDNFNADSNTVTVTLNVQYRFEWFSYSGLLFNEQVLNQVTAGSDVPIRFTLYGFKGNPYSSPPVSQQISCSTFAPTGPAIVINRYAPDPYYSSLYDFYQTTWRTQANWKFTCRRLTLNLADGTTRSLNFYFK